MWQPGSLEFDEIEGDIVIKDADDIVVAGPIYKYFTTAGGDNVRAVDIENGRLFAAAPDLLAAANAAIDALDMNDEFGDDIDARHACEEEAFRLLVLAINKAIQG